MTWTAVRPARLLFAMIRCLVLLLLAAPAAAQTLPTAVWRRIDIPETGSHVWIYVPASLDRSQPAPLALFFHGAGSSPSPYTRLVTGAAERAGTVVAMPRSSGLGWGTATDDRTVEETLRRVRAELSIDGRRIALAGHSAGGAYAVRLAYAGAEHSAVFTLAAPFIPVSAVVDPSYTPPVRMYYGTADPNYASSYPRLRLQWERLGVPWEEDVRPGYGHNDWPEASMEAGFLFLVGKSRPAQGCVATGTALCLHGRFRVEVSWQDFSGGTGAGRIVPTGASSGSGLFWFFGPDNWELMVKVVDGCSVNGHHWVFAAATTSVRYVLTVTDTTTGRIARYENPLGVASPAITDTSAFPACP
jgi:poly(3-hydroxybutyrate) depolymerase